MSKCPIAWTQKDGPYPCAFLQNQKECTRNDPWHQCIPFHQEKWNHAVKPVTVHCSRCGVEISTTNGVIERYGQIAKFEVICGACSDYDETLARHIAGEL